MKPQAGPALTNLKPKCEHCGKVLGVYEPIVIVADAGVRVSARAAEPQLGPHSGRLYHRDCHTEVTAAAA